MSVQNMNLPKKKSPEHERSYDIRNFEVFMASCKIKTLTSVTIKQFSLKSKRKIIFPLFSRWGFLMPKGTILENVLLCIISFQQLSILYQVSELVIHFECLV